MDCKAIFAIVIPIHPIEKDCNRNLIHNRHRIENCRCEWNSHFHVYIKQWSIRVRLHQASASMLRQLCDDACNFVFIENSGVAQKWVATPFWSDSIVFNENRIASVITALMLTLGVNGPLGVYVLNVNT